MQKHPNLTDFFRARSSLEDQERVIQEIKKEVTEINTKMKVLPTSREMDAKEDLHYLKNQTKLLLEENNKVFENLAANPGLQKILIEDLFYNVACSFIKTRIYNNKSLIKVTDKMFTNLVIWISKNIGDCSGLYLKLLNAIVNPSGEFFKNNGQEPIHRYPFGELIDASEEHKRWVDGLKIGERVDFLRGSQDFKIWTRAVIVDNDYNLKIRFLNTDITHYVRNPYYDFAPFGTKSNDFDWRMGLKKNDEVDFFRYNSKWNVYEVIEVIEERMDATSTEISKKVKIVKKGEKNYMEYDMTEIHVNSPLLAKSGWYSDKKNDLFEEDRLYLSQTEEPKFAIMRKFSYTTTSSVYIIKYINQFGKHGGFDFVLKVMKKEVEVSKEVFGYLITFLQSVGEFLVEPFIEKNGLLILTSIQDYLLSNAELNLRDITPKTLQVLINGIKGLAQRIHSEEEAEKIASKIKTKLAILCLKSDFLEKQFFGAKILTQIKSENEVNQELQEELVRFNVFDKIIKGHPHLIAKGEGVMKILFEAKVLQEKDLLSLWNQILKTDIESRNSLLKLLSQVIPNFSDKEILFLASKMLESSNEINDNEIISVLFKIQSMGHLRESLKDIIKIINDTLWGVIQSSKKLKDEFLNEVLNNFVTTLEKEENCEYISFIIENILQENRLTRNALLLKKLLNSLNLKIRESVRKNIEESQMVEKIIGWILAILKKNKNENYNENDSRQINERFGLLVDIYEKYEDEELVKFELIEKIWEEVFFNNIYDGLFLNWLKLFFTKSKSIKSDQFFVSFFERYISKMHEPLKEPFFYVLLLVFFKIQLFRSNVIKKTVFLETTGVIKNFKDSKEIFVLNNRSENLKCFGELWDFFKKTDNPKLEEDISKFLVKLLIPKKEITQNGELYAEEEQKLLAKIFQLLQQENAKIQKGISLLAKMIKIKEENGFGILNSFSSMLITPRVILEIQQNTYYYKNSFTLQVGLNTSLGALRSKISNTYEMEFASVKITANNVELPHHENSRVLGELSITENENRVAFVESDKWRIYVDEYALPIIEEAPILDEREEAFTPKALSVFKQIFAQYSTNGKMSRKNLADMTSAATDKMICRVDDDRVTHFFYRYDPDNKGYISEDKFIEFYLESARKNKIKTVRNNLYSFGFNKNLEPRNSTQVANENSIKNSLRYNLTQNDQFWSILKKLLGELTLSSDLYEIINLLTPNYSFLKNVSLNPLANLIEFNTPLLWYFYCGVIDSLLSNRNELLPFLTFLELEKDFKIEAFFAQIFQNKFSLFFVENLNQVENEFQHIFLTSFSLMDKFLKICLNFTKTDFLHHFAKNKKNDEEEKHDEEKKETKKKNSLSDEEKNKFNKIDPDISKKEETAQLEFLTTLLNSQSVQNFLINLDFLKINQFCKDSLLNFLKNKKNADLKQLQLITRFCSVWTNTFLLNEEKMITTITDPNFENFVIKGLTIEEEKIRSIFLHHFNTLLQHCESFYLKTYCLKLFIKNIQNNGDSNIQAIIELSSNLLSQISGFRNKEEVSEETREILKEFEFLKLFEEFSLMVRNYESREKTYDDTDSTLVAILTFMSKILEAENEIVNLIKKEEMLLLVDFLFKKCLFEINDTNINFSNLVCKSKSSRTAALDLLRHLTYKNEDYSYHLLKTGFRHLIPFIPEQTNNFSISNYNEKKSKLNFLGIKNPGCVCYMIAMLQQFYCTPTFRYGVLMADDKREYNKFEQDGFEIDDNVFHQLQNMFSYLDCSERKAFDPKAFCMSYMDITGQRVDISVQQDSQEFLNVIFDRIDRALQPTPFKGIMDSVFAGKIASVYTCKSCNNVFSNEQLFYNLSLEVKNMENIEDSFRKFNSEEIISDYTCENCKTKVDVSKRAYIKELPNTLIIHLQKIIFDLEYLANIKLGNKYEFGKEINLRNYIFKQKPVGEEEEEEMMEEEDQEDYSYKLVGVVLHRGNAEYGHYTSLINVNRNDPNRPDIEKDLWLNFDDSRISEYNMEQFEEDCFGEEQKNKNSHSSHLLNLDLGSSKSAYILVYDKVKKTNIHFQFNETNSAEKERVIECLIKKDDYKFENNILETGFYNIGKFIPTRLKDKINTDNSSLVLEEQLFNKSFTTNFSSFILNCGLPPLAQIKNSDSNKTQKKLAEVLVEVIPVFIKKVYCVAVSNESLPSLDLTLKKAMFVLKEKKDVFFEKFLQDEFYVNISFLIGKSDAVVRQSLGSIFATCYELYANEHKIDLFAKSEGLDKKTQKIFKKALVEYLEKLPSKYCNNYRKYYEYFTTLKQMIKKIPFLGAYMIKKDYLKKVIQFYICQDAKMVSERNVMMITLSLLTLILKNYRALPESVQKRTKKNYDESVAILKTMDFFEKVIKEDFLSYENFVPISNLVLFLTKDDLVLSSLYINKVLKSLPYSVHENIVTTMEIMDQMLNMKDAFQKERIRMLLGLAKKNDTKVKTPHQKVLYNYGLARDLTQKKNANSFVSPAGSEKSILHHIYKNRKFNDTSCFLMMFFVLKMCNKNELFLEYFLSLPGFDYNEPNHFCWYESFISKTLNYLINKNQFMKKELVDYCFKNIEKEFDIFKKKLEKIVPLNARLFSEETSEDEQELFIFGDTQYIIGKTNKVTPLSVLKINNEKLKFEIQLINVCLMPLKTNGQKILNFNINDYDEDKNGVKKFIGEKYEEFDQDRENFYQVENSDSEKEEEEKTEINENEEFVNNDYIIRIAVSNFSHESYFVKLKISSDLENANFEESQVVVGVNRKKQDLTILNLAKKNLGKNFEGIKIEVAFCEIDFLVFKDFDEDSLSNFEVIYYPQ